jgi:hypothetical protein
VPAARHLKLAAAVGVLLLQFGVRLRAAAPVPLGLLQVGADDVQAEPGQPGPLVEAAPAFEEVVGAAALEEAVGEALALSPPSN